MVTEEERARAAEWARGCAARKKGRRNEERVLEAVKRLGGEDLLDARLATPDEDAKGVDVVVTSWEFGTFFLQVKSSRCGAAAAKPCTLGPYVCVVVIAHPNDSKMEAAVLEAMKAAKARIASVCPDKRFPR
jgi:hypothetical protein